MRVPVAVSLGLLVLLGAFGAAPGRAAAQCAAPAADPIAFDAMNGVRTKWQIDHDTSDRDKRFTIQPDLNNQSLVDWMRALEATGVNVADLNIDSSKNLSATPEISDADWSRYLDDIYDMPALISRNDKAELDFVGGIRGRMVGAKTDLYTPAQRDQALLKFLAELQALKAAGSICGNVRFIVHQRLWFRSDLVDRSARYLPATEAGFAGDMAGFINQARAQNLDHWLAGIRLGENSNKDMSQLLPILIDLATQVNAQTGGWLRSHVFLANGGGWGAYYRGIGNVAGPDGAPLPFFALMARQTGAFAFGYKWMDSGTAAGDQQSINGRMTAGACPSGGAAPRYCDPQSAADWRYFLGTDFGFDELAAYVNANHAAYPMQANVVFVGDSSDSIRQMVQPAAGGALADTPAMAALRGLFAQAAAASPGGSGWRGRMFLNGFSNLDDNTASDDGMSLLYFSGSPMNFTPGTVSPLARTAAEWRCWPAVTCQ